TEEWIISPRAGDCNDYAVTKRHELLARGWPSRALLLSEVVTTWGEHHLVVVVSAEKGDFVLDNLNNDVRPVTLAGYRWVRAQSPDNPKFWSTVRIAANVAETKPIRQAHVASLRNRAALALRKSETDDCCGTDAYWSAEYAILAEAQQQE